MIQTFLTSVILHSLLVITFIFWVMYLFIVCMFRHNFKHGYPKKEFILDLIIPFRYFYKAFYNLFKD